MDNLTHTLIGGAYFSLLPKRLRTKSAFVSATIASNLPDIDVLLRAIPGKTHFDYLIHHRGYTHTFLLALPFAFALAWMIHRWMKDQVPKLTLTLISIGAVFLHFFADYWNDYGIHPFSPFWNQWFYGDSIFIVEPYLWFTLLPMIVSIIISKPAKRTFQFIFVLAFGLLWFSDAVALVPAIALTVTAIFWSIYFYRPRKTWPAVVFCAAVIGLFFVNSHQVRNLIRAPLTQAGQVLDIESAPAPGNAFCWRSIAHVRNGDQNLIVFSQVTLWSLPLSCKLARSTPQTAPFHAFTVETNDPRINWLGVHFFKQSEFDSLAERSCTFRRLLGFARFPFFKKTGPDQYVAGDLRYDREPGSGFSEVEFALPDDCGGKTSPWNPPFKR